MFASVLFAYDISIVHNIYRPPMKLQKGNVFIRMSDCPHGEGGTHMTITHDALDLIVQGLPPLSPAPAIH